MLKGLFQHFNKEQPSPKKEIKPCIIPRNEHTISRQAISANALKVLYRLHKAGYGAYLVGGCVRDLLLGRTPKDFDIATDARPEEVRKLFKNCRLIGKRFRLAHVVFGKEIIEVATFRTHHENAQEEEHARLHKGMIVRDNVYGSIEDDVCRRDFSINALYYNIADFSVLDYTNGMQDIKSKLLRIIGEPKQRFHEDPVRLLRAARFIGKLKLNVSPETEVNIGQLCYLLQQVSSARLYQEVLKFFAEGELLDTFLLLRKYKLFEQLFPQTDALLHQATTLKLLETSLSNTDQRLRIGKTVSPAFLFAVFLWHPILEHAKQEEEKGFSTYTAFERAIHIVLKKQTEQLAIPRVLQVSIRDICFLQHRFTTRHGSRPHRVLSHPRFRAAYDLMALRADSGEEDTKDLFDWWTAFHSADPELRDKMLKSIKRSGPGKKRRRSKKFSKKQAVLKPESTDVSYPIDFQDVPQS